MPTAHVSIQVADAEDGERRQLKALGFIEDHTKLQLTISSPTFSPGHLLKSLWADLEKSRKLLATLGARGSLSVDVQWDQRDLQLGPEDVQLMVHCKASMTLRLKR